MSLAVATRFRKQLLPYLGTPCPWCGVTMGEKHDVFPTRDHVLPKSRTGKGFDHTGNTVIVCRNCNEAKKHYTLSEWLDRLKRGRSPRVPFIEAWVATREQEEPPKHQSIATLADVWPVASEAAA